MKIIAYPLSDQAVVIESAQNDSTWSREIAAHLALSTVNGKGWDLLAPYGVEATWNGGPAPEDIDIRIEAPDVDAPAFVQSYLGGGLLTFYPGYQFQTEAPHGLWVRGPVNWPKDGLQALEHIVDTSLLPCTITISWMFTRPNHTIRLTAGEPFATILPYAKSAPENLALDVVQPDADANLDAYEQAFQQLTDSAAVQSVFQRLSTPPVLGIVFSRDRAMQLDATLRSFHLHCQDPKSSKLYVIYKTTNRRHAQQYLQLSREYAAYGYIHFVEETDFHEQVLQLLASHRAIHQAGYILFLVDDNLFVRDFSLREIQETLAAHPEAAAFSLRLGANTTYRYAYNQTQVAPALKPIREHVRIFDWTTAQGHFNYPLEVSSSVFRSDELARLVDQLSFNNPNTLEAYLQRRRSMLAVNQPALLCYEQSVAFCNPINKVQTVFANRAGAAPEYAVEQLAELFDQGYRVRVDAYAGFVPNSCGQEVELIFEQCLEALPAETRQPAQPGNRYGHADEQPMRIGYLILAHNVPNHFARLVHALSDPHAHIYVHVDQKSDILPFQAKVPTERVRFLANRIPVYWGEYSVVQAILNLMAEALNHEPRLDYLCLLSGSDYPLRNVSYIRRFFAHQRGTEFMNLLTMPNPKLGKPIERLTRYRFQHDHAQKLAKRLGVARLPIYERDYHKAFGALQPYCGSLWWALSRAACEYILHFTTENRQIVKFYRNTLIPDEGFFQTIIGNSPFRTQVAHNLTFNDWSRPVRPRPAIIDEQHMRHFLAAPTVLVDDPYGKGELLFARKFPDDSEWLVAQLQARLEQPLVSSR